MSGPILYRVTVTGRGWQEELYVVAADVVAAADLAVSAAADRQGWGIPMEPTSIIVVAGTEQSPALAISGRRVTP